MVSDVNGFNGCCSMVVVYLRGLAFLGFGPIMRGLALCECCRGDR